MLHARKSYMRIQDPLPEDQGGISVDEPVFLLRAKDKAAAGAVKCWAAIAEALGADWRIVLSARNHADAMELWGEKQIPDMPEGDGAEI